jgi:hypothetical protein
MAEKKDGGNVVYVKSGVFPGTLPEYFFADAWNAWAEETYTDPFEILDGYASEPEGPENDCRE